jgi:hypothetical protein
MSKMTTSSKENYRSEETGRFVTKNFTETHPKTTVKETKSGASNDTGPRKNKKK